MGFKKKKNLVGLDIGTSLIKVAELKKSAKGYVLKKFGTSKVPEGAIQEGAIYDAKGLSDVIRAMFKSKKIRKKNIAVSTGGDSVVIKTISVPQASEKELQDSIWFEAEQYIPYDLEDVNVDFQILGESEDSPEHMNVLLVAVKKDIVADYIDLVNLAGLNPCVIDVDTFALQNIYEAVTLEQEGSNKITMLVDIGFSKLSINILRGKSSLLTRDSSLGVSQIIEEIVSNRECSVKEAEDILKGRETGLMSKPELDSLCLDVFKSWCSEISSVIQTFQSKSNERDVEKIVLCGGGASIKNFIQTLSAEAPGIDVTIFNPFDGLKVEDKGLTSEKSLAPLAPIAIGLALRQMDDK
ncbi:MAG: type IV pilus assembly protein PilM [Desulfobacteraceae bacterium]